MHAVLVPLILHVLDKLCGYVFGKKFYVRLNGWILKNQVVNFFLQHTIQMLNIFNVAQIDRDDFGAKIDFARVLLPTSIWNFGVNDNDVGRAQIEKPSRCGKHVRFSDLTFGLA